MVLCIVFFMDGRNQWWFYSLVYLICFIFAFLCIFTIIAYYVELHKAKGNLPWITLELFFNIIAAVTCIVLAIVLIWDSWMMSSGSNMDIRHHSGLPPRNIGRTAWIRRLRVVAGSLFVAALLFTISLVKTNRNGIQ
ncbi:hypothetical protein WR25_01873 [Diploscapter pachys]|uniref:MARVEL domain-containing protein n=1 Tax=Diploscapter pachys TaxID=2018661 RepID=A0A2A2KWD2_9BILA|nr:hypothetical protein WR25_01873 [Diploscapter pachys]